MKSCPTPPRLRPELHIVTELPTPYTDLASCRQTLSGGSRSFWVASQLLPGTLKNAACGLYAFCREADDAIDEVARHEQDRALAELHRRLDRIYNPHEHALSSATDRVLASIVQEHHLPRPLLDALLEGFSWDAAGRRYQTLSEVFDYSARVAGTVGVMMAVLMGVRDVNALARAADLGVAMQLTNIARDVGEDARAGRLYLPTDLLQAEGICPEAFLTQPSYSDGLGRVVQTLLDTADTLYKRSEHGVPSLPLGCRPGILAARTLYAAIGDKLRTMGYNSVDTRSVLGMSQKLGLVLRTLRMQNLSQSRLRDAPLREVAFLIEAVKARPLPPAHSVGCEKSPKGYYGRVLWMLDLFAALEQRPLATNHQAGLTNQNAGAYETVAGSAPSGSQSA